MSVSCECCVLSGRGLCVGLSLFESRSTECGVTIECDCVAPFAKAMARNRAEAPQERNIHIIVRVQEPSGCALI
jgi:hypothetical protein